MFKFINIFSLTVLVLSSLLVAKVSPRGLENALDISASGVIANRMRAQVIAENIANIDTIDTGTGMPYQKKEVIMKPAENFNNPENRLSGGVLRGVVVAEVAQSTTANSYYRIYQPDHPNADSQGFVRYPKIDLTKEMVSLTRASGAFENNVVVFNATKAMMQSSLEIGQ